MIHGRIYSNVKWYKRRKALRVHVVYTYVYTATPTTAYTLLLLLFTQVRIIFSAWLAYYTYACVYALGVGIL